MRPLTNADYATFAYNLQQRSRAAMVQEAIKEIFPDVVRVKITAVDYGDGWDIESVEMFDKNNNLIVPTSEDYNKDPRHAEKLMINVDEENDSFTFSNRPTSLYGLEEYLEDWLRDELFSGHAYDFKNAYDFTSTYQLPQLYIED